jgi:glucokinase
MKAVAQGLTTSIGQLANFDLNRVTPEIIYRAAKQGDEIARDIYEQAGEALGIAIGNIMVSVLPQRVVLCGGVAQASDLLLPAIWRTVKERVNVVPIEDIEILRGQAGDNAGVLGAAAWARGVTQR